MSALTNVKRCKLIDLPKISDSRGNLTFIEGHRHVPFDIKRIFYVYDVPADAERGGHAHKETQQLLIVMSGSCDVTLDDGYTKERLCLNRPDYGLYIGPLIWDQLGNFSSGCICMVAASGFYDEADYYRNYNAFLQAVRGGV
jgi:hypothetical protein